MRLQNYEEGAENTVDNGDAGGEVMLQEFGPMAPIQGERDIPNETQVSSSRSSMTLCRNAATHGVCIFSSNMALELGCGASCDYSSNTT